VRKGTAALFVLTLCALPLVSIQAAPALEGTWSGNGYAVPKSGDRESVRCRVRYSRQSSKVFSVAATCSSATTNVVQTGEVLEVSNGRHIGYFYNPQCDISCRVRIQMSGNHQTVSFSGSQGQGGLPLSKLCLASSEFTKRRSSPSTVAGANAQTAMLACQQRDQQQDQECSGYSGLECCSTGACKGGADLSVRSVSRYATMFIISSLER
jgi:hypothetical protein